ncbi:MAG: efflux RND transporter permease subunit, partial [Leeuwenhoekiella sp.]|nr:efflux RND transporter permease subunit [Leeuwenhoekiella sp.]
MFSQFIKRPVFAIVISIIILFIGSLAIKQLPISQFPQIAPTTVNIFIAYPGASADVLVKSTLITLENAINGVEDMRYMATDATSAGEATLRIIFEPGVDPNDAVVRVKTRVDQVMPLLPELVQREGVVITPVQPSMLMYVNLYSKDKSMDEKFLYNYADVKMIPEINRLKGVARSQILGSRRYAMRVWLNPERMRAYNVSVEEVMESLQEQSIIGRPGRLGQSSGITAQSLEYVLTYKGRFNEPEEYENVIIRANADGESIHLKDIGKVELGSEFFDIYSNLDGHPSAAIVLKQNYGSNASDVIDEVKEKLEEMKADFPPGMDYKISYDVSNFLDASIEQVIDTLRDAFLLVAFVVFIFLGDWRSTLIPIIAVPVSLVGAFFVIQLFGMSINLVTLFALVLAIGIVVDDAIVVVEAVHAKLDTGYTSARKASIHAMNEISGAIISITLVMSAVFIPVTFISGSTGVFYKQFGVTLAIAIILSAINALTLSPALCALLLKPHDGDKKHSSFTQRFYTSFNVAFDNVTGKYKRSIQFFTKKKWIIVAAITLFGGGLYYMMQTTPSGFVPSEDHGTIFANISLP